MLSREQLQQNIVAMEKQGAPPQDIQAYLDAQKAPAQAPPPTPTIKHGGVSILATATSPGLPGLPTPTAMKYAGTMIRTAPATIKDAFAGGKQQLDTAITDIKHGGTPVEQAEHVVSGLSGAASMVTSPLAPIFHPISQAINEVSEKVTDIPAVQKAASKLPDLPYKRIGKFIGDAANVVSTALGVKGAVETAPKVASAVKEVASQPEPSALLDHYYKAIKPLNSGKTSMQQIETYNGKVQSAVTTIAQNKGALKFQDELGDLVTGQLPKNRIEHAQAIDQTKGIIFDKYNALQKTAGAQGAKVDLSPVGSALDEVINNESLELTHPEAVAYARTVQHRLTDPITKQYRQIDTELAQQAIQNYNESLQAFYRNPSYESASRAAIDAGVVNKLREGLDEVVNSFTGENYQGLKNQYSALKAIEKDSARAAMQAAKQIGTNSSGIGKYIDIFSGGDMVHGVLSLNPAIFAKGIAQTGIKSYFQWLNNPDRAIRNMYKAAEQ